MPSLKPSNAPRIVSWGVFLVALLCSPTIVPETHAADGAWTLLHGPLDPPALSNASTIVDEVHRRVLAFGFLDGAVHEMRLDGAPEWHLLRCVGPAPRTSGLGSAVLDPVRNRVLWFGGNCDGIYTCPGADVSVLDLAGAVPTWSTLDVTGVRPPTRFGQAAVFDVESDRMIVYGGKGGSPLDHWHWLGDVWALSFIGAPCWTEITPAGPGPGERTDMAVAFDAARNRMLIHGGFRFVEDPTLPDGGITTVFDDVWALSLGSNPMWSAVVTDGAKPPARWAHTAAYDPIGDHLLIANGIGASYASLGDAWQLPLSGGPLWSPIYAPGGPSQTYGRASVVDPASARWFLFGGYSIARKIETLRLDSPHDPWLSLTVPEPGLYPGRLSYPLAFYDSPRGRMLLFNPTTSAVWVWTASIGWSQLPIAGDGGRAVTSNRMAYDSKRDRLLFAGDQDRAYRGEMLDHVYALDLAGPFRWRLLPVSETLPPGRAEACMGYDPVRDRLIVTGGSYQASPSGARQTRSDTWSLLLNNLTWTQLPAEPAVTFTRASAPLVYDARRDAMDLFGGGTSFSYSRQPQFEAWTLPLGSTTSVWLRLAPAPPVLDVGFPYPFRGLVDLPADRLVAVSLADHAAYSHPLDGSGAWTPLAFEGEFPPPRGDAVFVLDAPAHRALLFGGDDGGPRGDLWSLRLDGALTVNVTAVTSDVRRDGVTLAWATSHGQRTFTVERATHGSAPWVALAQVDSDPTGRVVFEDRAVTVGAAYDYRLTYGEGSAIWVGGLVAVGLPPVPTLALAGARPNPAVRGLIVEFSLPDDGVATIELLDVSGRRILMRDLGAPGPGTHTVDLAAGRRYPAGIYLVRLRHAGSERVRRVTLLK